MSQSIRRALYRAEGLPDPGPTPSVEMREVIVLMPRLMWLGIQELDEMLVPKHFPSRNDLLVALIEEGLRVSAQAAVEARAVKEAIAEVTVKPDIEVDTNRPDLEIIPKEGVTPAEAAQMSSRLRALRGSDGAPRYGVRESKPDPMVTE